MTIKAKIYHLLSRAAKSIEPAELKVIPKYPPKKEGYGIFTVEEIKQAQKDIIRDIRRALPLSLDERKDYLEDVLDRFINYVDLLPASKEDHHYIQGGLFRHALEVARYMLMKIEAVNPYANPNLELDPRQRAECSKAWILANFYAGLLHDIGKPLTDVEVVDESGSLVWEPSEKSLKGWVSDNKLDRYWANHVKGRNGKHKNAGSLIMKEVIGNKVWGYLINTSKKNNQPIFDNMIAAITDLDKESDISQRVALCDQRSVREDKLENNFNPTLDPGTVPVISHLKDAMRYLIEDGTWKINEAGARLWHTPNGFFLAWHQGVKDIQGYIRKNRIHGFPHSEHSIAEKLLECGIAEFVKLNDQEHTLIRIEPDILTKMNGDRVGFKAIKLTSPTIVMDKDDLPEMTDIVIGGMRRPVSDIELAQDDVDAPEHEYTVLENDVEHEPAVKASNVTDHTPKEDLLQSGRSEQTVEEGVADHRDELDDLADDFYTEDGDDFDFAGEAEAVEATPDQDFEDSLNESQSSQKEEFNQLLAYLKSISASYTEKENQLQLFVGDPINPYLSQRGIKFKALINALVQEGVLVNVPDKRDVYVEIGDGGKAIYINRTYWQDVKTSLELQSADVINGDSIQAELDLDVTSKTPPPKLDVDTQLIPESLNSAVADEAFDEWEFPEFDDEELDEDDLPIKRAADKYGFETSLISIGNDVFGDGEDVIDDISETKDSSININNLQTGKDILSGYINLKKDGQVDSVTLTDVEDFISALEDSDAKLKLFFSWLTDESLKKNGMIAMDENAELITLKDAFWSEHG